MALASLTNVNSEAITLNFANGNYYLDSPVSVDFTVYSDNASLRFLGTSTPSNYNNKGSVITGKAAITSMFIFKGVTLNTSFFYSFLCQNISFLSGAFGTTGPKSALLSLGGGQSSRPFVVESCTFKGFTAAIKSDMTGTSLSTGICNVTIRKNYFQVNTYSLHGVGADSIVGLDFSDNQAGTGGGINAVIGSYYTIRNNIMESNATALGNAPSIVISGGLHNGVISGNYFEAINTGDLINISATAPFSDVLIHSNFISSCSGSSITCSGVNVTMPQDLSWAGVYTRLTQTTGKSIINCSGMVYPQSVVSGASCEVSLDINSVPLNSTLPPATLSNAGWSNAVGAAVVTPILGATVNVDTINGVGVYRTYGTSVVAGDWIVFQALARRRGTGTNALYIEILNAAGSAQIGLSSTNSYNLMTAVGEWYYIMKQIQITGASGANILFGYSTAVGTSIDVTSTYIYRVASPTINTPIYLFLPPL